MKPSGDAWARQLLFKGIRFERRGDTYAAIESYREAIAQTAVGSDLHLELTQILASLQSRVAQPGARGPHYDGGVNADPEGEDPEVRRNYDLADSAYNRGDWRTAAQALEFVVRYRPFFVERQRPAWKFLEEVRIRAADKTGAVRQSTAGAVWKGVGALAFILFMIVIGLAMRGKLFPRSTPAQPAGGVPGQQVPAGGVPGQVAPGQQPGGLPAQQPGGGALPEVQVNLPPTLRLGSQLQLDPGAGGWTLDWQDGGGGGLIVRAGNQVFWRPPPTARPGDAFKLYVQARNQQGQATAPKEHTVTIVP